MSRKGECLDNAVAESFFGTLKNELVYHEDYRTKAQARQSLFEYIESSVLLGEVQSDPIDTMQNGKNRDKVRYNP
jgi:transposase InsO family protein